MKKTNEGNPPKTLTQIERFQEVARQLDCDESEAAFDDKLRQIAQPKTGQPSK